ncbi:unnamed protein product [Amoebophrya sp. A25]|nr:unnamed protein product [Amoebophrya sp. A25]|eukprot:GSA25T00019946001.1
MHDRRVWKFEDESKMMTVRAYSSCSIDFHSYNFSELSQMLEAGTQGIRGSRLKDTQAQMGTGDVICQLAPLEMRETMLAGGISLLVELLRICVTVLFNGDMKRSPCLIVHGQVIQYFTFFAQHMSLQITDPRFLGLSYVLGHPRLAAWWIQVTESLLQTRSRAAHGKRCAQAHVLSLADKAHDLGMKLLTENLYALATALETRRSDALQQCLDYFANFAEEQAVMYHTAYRIVWTCMQVAMGRVLDKGEHQAKMADEYTDWTGLDGVPDDLAAAMRKLFSSFVHWAMYDAIARLSDFLENDDLNGAKSELEEMPDDWHSVDVGVQHKLAERIREKEEALRPNMQDGAPPAPFIGHGAEHYLNLLQQNRSAAIMNVDAGQPQAAGAGVAGDAEEGDAQQGDEDQNMEE